MVMIPVQGAGKAPEFECEGEGMAKRQTKNSAETVAEKENGQLQDSREQELSMEDGSPGRKKSLPVMPRKNLSGKFCRSRIISSGPLSMGAGWMIPRRLLKGST